MININIIEDDQWFSLQRRLLKDKAKLNISVEAAPNKEDGNTTDVRGIVPVYKNWQELPLNADYYIIDDSKPEVWEYLKWLGHTNVCGYSKAVLLLEQNRRFAFAFLEKHVPSGLLNIPENREFFQVEAAVNFLQNSNKLWVLKQTDASPQEIFCNRTVITSSHNAISLLKKPNAWFRENQGGIRLEEYIKGQEVSFGRWFDGESFIGPVYSYIEYKGAQNNTRGNILTGEVGTVVKYFPARDSKTNKIFESLKPLLTNNCQGMIDINTIMDGQGNLNFVEFTCRFGRPTLDIQLAMTKVNLAKALKQGLGITHEGDLDNWYTGVTVFTYGYPVIEPYCEEADSIKLPSVRYSLPKNTKNSSCEPLFSSYDRKQKTYIAKGYDRHFVSIGKGKTIKDSVVNAYSPLQDFSLYGCTWRDDIGKDLKDFENSLLNYNIV